MKKIITILLSLIVIFSLIGCKSNMPEISTTTIENNTNEIKPVIENNKTNKEKTINIPYKETLILSLANGIGNWQNNLFLNTDGTFSGDFYDLNMGETDTNYRNGTYYYNNYSGKIKSIKEITAYSYEIYLDTLNYKYKDGKENIEDGIKNIAIENITGINENSRYILYLPNTPISDLPKYIDTWLLGINLKERVSSGVYILYNETEDMAFYYNKN